METQDEENHLQGKERGFRRNQPCRHLDLRLPATRTEIINACCLCTVISYTLLGWPEQTHTHNPDVRALRKKQGLLCNQPITRLVNSPPCPFLAVKIRQKTQSEKQRAFGTHLLVVHFGGTTGSVLSLRIQPAASLSPK